MWPLAWFAVCPFSLCALTSHRRTFSFPFSPIHFLTCRFSDNRRRCVRAPTLFAFPASMNTRATIGIVQVGDTTMLLLRKNCSLRFPSPPITSDECILSFAQSANIVVAFLFSVQSKDAICHSPLRDGTEGRTANTIRNYPKHSSPCN